MKTLTLTSDDIPKFMPKISTDYVLMDNCFYAPPIKDESVYDNKNSSNGDILRDLGFPGENETDIRKTIQYLNNALERFW